MAGFDRHTMRRMILDATADAAPAAVTIDDLAEAPQFAVRIARRLTTPGEIGEVCAGLALHGYLVDLRPGREPLYRVTAKGDAQRHRETDLDEYIWGEHASRFAGGAQ